MDIICGELIKVTRDRLELCIRDLMSECRRQRGDVDIICGELIKVTRDRLELCILDLMSECRR